MQLTNQLSTLSCTKIKHVIKLPVGYFSLFLKKLSCNVINTF